jgi:hypothetical protein
MVGLYTSRNIVLLTDRLLKLGRTELDEVPETNILAAHEHEETPKTRQNRKNTCKSTTLGFLPTFRRCTPFERGKETIQ